MTVSTLRNSGLLPLAIAAAAAPVAFVLARDIAHGSITQDILIAAMLVAPLAVWYALTRPLVFPYALYVTLLPFDAFLAVGHSGTITKLLGIVSGLVLLFYCLRTQRIAFPRLPLYVLGGFIAWTAITMLWAVDNTMAVDPLLTLLGLALLYTALSFVPVSLTDFKIVLAATAAGYLAVACYGIITSHGSNAAATLANADPNRLFISIGGNFIDPNEYADSLIFPIAIAMMFGFRANYLSLRLLWYAVAGAMVVAIALSGSREAVIALAAIIVYFAIRSRQRIQVYLLVTLMLLAAGSQMGTVMDRFQTALSTGGAGRTSIWSVGLVAAKHYGLLGSGIGTFPIVYDRFYLSVPQTYLYGWSAPPHNVPLRYLVELGVLGLALVVFFIVAHFVILRTIGRDHPLYDFRVLMEAGLIGLCISSVFIDSFHAKWTWLVFATSVQLVNLASLHKRSACNPSTLPESARQQLVRNPLQTRVLPHLHSP